MAEMYILYIHVIQDLDKASELWLFTRRMHADPSRVVAREVHRFSQPGSLNMSSCGLLVHLQDGLQSTALFNSMVDAYGKVPSQAFFEHQVGCRFFRDEAGDLKAAVATFDTMRPSSLDGEKPLLADAREALESLLQTRTPVTECIDLFVPARASAVLPNKTSYNILVNSYAQAVPHSLHDLTESQTADSCARQGRCAQL